MSRSRVLGSVECEEGCVDGVGSEISMVNKPRMAAEMAGRSINV